MFLYVCPIVVAFWYFFWYNTDMEKGGIRNMLAKAIAFIVFVGTFLLGIIQTDFSAPHIRGNIGGIAGLLRAAWAVILTVKIPLGILTLSAIVFFIFRYVKKHYKRTTKVSMPGIKMEKKEPAAAQGDMVKVEVIKDITLYHYGQTAKRGQTIELPQGESLEKDIANGKVKRV